MSCGFEYYNENTSYQLSMLLPAGRLRFFRLPGGIDHTTFTDSFACMVPISKNVKCHATVEAVEITNYSNYHKNGRDTPADVK